MRSARGSRGEGFSSRRGPAPVHQVRSHLTGTPEGARKGPHPHWAALWTVRGLLPRPPDRGREPKATLSFEAMGSTSTLVQAGVASLEEDHRAILWPGVLLHPRHQRLHARAHTASQSRRSRRSQGL